MTKLNRLIYNDDIDEAELRYQIRKRTTLELPMDQDDIKAVNEALNPSFSRIKTTAQVRASFDIKMGRKERLEALRKLREASQGTSDEDLDEYDRQLKKIL